MPKPPAHSASVEWVRLQLVTAATSEPSDHVLLAEVLALRAIVLTLQFALATGETLTPDDDATTDRSRGCRQTPQGTATGLRVRWGVRHERDLGTGGRLRARGRTPSRSGPLRR